MKQNINNWIVTGIIIIGIVLLMCSFLDAILGEKQQLNEVEQTDFFGKPDFRR